MNIQELSALGIVTAAVVYLLAFMAHAAEWASARGLSAEPATEPATAGQRELVGAGVGGGSLSQDPRSQSSDPSSLSLSTGPEADADHAARLRVDMFGRMGVGLTIIAAASHLMGMVLRGVAGRRLPWGNMYEFTVSALAFAVIAYLVLVLRKNMRWLGLPMTLLLAIGCGLAATVFHVAVAPLVPALHSVWFIIHIVAACISGAAFNLGGMASIIYLFKARSEQRGSTTGYLAKLPSSQKMDTFAYRAHAFAFPIWTFTIAAGSIWAEYAWGRFWGWDPKETWSLVTWVVYACYLHARATAGWKGRNAAIIAIIGVASFWFNFIGVNLVFSGLHSYAGI